MDMTLPAIEVAYRGRVAMLRAIFGSSEGGDADAPAPGAPALTPTMFSAMFSGKRGASN